MTERTDSMENATTRVTTQPVTLIVTTYRTDTFYTQACLEAIRRWKSANHQLIVVTHDETPLLRAYLDACRADRLIDRLIYAESNHGHTRSFNLGVRYATSDVVFNICNDILIGPAIVDDCAWQLRTNAQIGLIGWHWYNEGTFWQNGQVAVYALRDSENSDLAPQDAANIRKAPWFTGRFFEGIGGEKWLQLCNTSFFGARRELLDKVGGGFGPQYAHYWADDFLNYAVLDQGLDIRNFDRRFRCSPFFHEFQYDQTDVEDRRRHADQLTYAGAFLESISHLDGGMSRDESIYLHLLAQSVPDGATVTNVGVWKGSSAVVLLDALKEKRITFYFIDGFDLPGVSSFSAQPPVTQDEFVSHILPYLGPSHSVNVIRANTLTLDRFPTSDFVFVDGGHTRECIENDASLAREALAAGGTAVFHDYGCPSWPDVQPALDQVFSTLEVYGTLAVYRDAEVVREAFQWATPKVAQRS